MLARQRSCRVNMFFTILASGSSGNCALISNGNTNVLIDCGCTISYLKRSFDEINFDINNVDALLITHSHTDHLRQYKMFNNTTIYSPFSIANVKNIEVIKPLHIFQIKDFKIMAIQLSHDCEITVGYIIYDGNQTYVHLTDTGYVSDTNKQLIKGADYYLFESNHDPEMLMNTNRPLQLKKRILSDHGHLSNEDASKVLAECISKNTKEIVLGHISQQANDPDLAIETLKKTLEKENIDYKKIKIACGKQYEIYKGGL